MFQRAAAYFYLVVALVFVCARWRALVSYGQPATAWTTEAYLEFARLFVVLVGVVVSVSFLRRGRRSRRLRGAQADDGPGHGGSFHVFLSELSENARAAFGRRPVLASLVLVIVVFIPICVIAAGHANGLNGFQLRDWILVAIMESPLVSVVFVVLVSFWKTRNRTR
jgi:hypothetical protein